jgi:hypothetical protein
MRHRILILPAIMLLVALQATGTHAQGDRQNDDRRQAAKFGWGFDLDKAKKLARKNDRPLMIVLRCVP